ncbi:MAG: GTPase domain-containing protein [Planctomycetes bacterium]|nr:GTPase domain-containing protein [Planctomycetota bacterium]
MPQAMGEEQEKVRLTNEPDDALRDMSDKGASSDIARELTSGTSKPPRDRIVILGRRRAGKTVFLARLYKTLWSSSGHFHMRALSGDSHSACMEVIDEMESGRWPASTLGSQYTDIEITYNGNKRLLVSLDYPGEVFRQAFVHNANTEDARELLDHVDRAAAVIILLDPGVIHSGKTDEVVDDEYGMTHVINRIREWPESKDVPIVIVYTKCDMHKKLLRDSGGLKKYAIANYMNLLRAMDRFKIFASAAVFTKPGLNGDRVPDMTRPPIGVIEPLEYCLQKISSHEIEKMDHEAQVASRLRVKKYHEKQHDDQKRAVMFWTVFWSIAVVGLFGIALVTWMILNGSE